MRTENTAKLNRDGSLSFYVDGRPAPQGSKKYMGHRGGKPILLESSKGLKEWREKIAWHARQARNLSLIHISEPTRHFKRSRMPSSA